MSKLFLSHSSQDDDFVRELQHALGYHNQDVWIDSRELFGGDLLWPEIICCTTATASCSRAPSLPAAA